MDRFMARLIAAWTRPRRKGPEVLDVWMGDTVEIRGHKLFKTPDGKLLPQIAGAGTQGWEETLESTIVDGTANTAGTEAIMVPDFNIPAFYMYPGRTLRIWASGIVSTVITTPGIGTWRVRWGGVGGVQLLASAGQNFNTVAQTSVGWNIMAYITCRTAGATGTFMSAGELSCFDILDSTSANLKAAVMGSAGTGSNAAVTVDTTTAKLLSVTYANTVATGSLTCQQRVIEALN